MAQNFFKRLREYYLNVAEVLRGDADAASVFPNPTDVGMARERVYVDFLRLHAPSKCNVFLGGFLFDENGAESRQLDVIVTTDTAPRFDLHNRDGTGKSFSPVEGTLGVASIKSYLNKAQLEDALLGISSIPPTKSLEGRVSPLVRITGYDDWPYKIVYATDGIQGQTLLKHLATFYKNHGDIAVSRCPSIIHVAGKYIVARAVKGMNLRDVTTGDEQELELGTFQLISRESDLQGILWVLEGLQTNASASTHILFSYTELINKVMQMS
jgi:hypothetical protein